jgi:tetratricopeptide (TPR) repeat protein
MRAAACALVVALAAGAPAAGPVELPGRGEKWIRFQTANFTLFSNTTEGKTREIGLDLERLRAVLLRIRHTLTASSPVPSYVYVFKSQSAFEPYWPRVDGKPEEVGGEFYPSRDGNYIALAAAWNSDPRGRIYHEYLHYFMHANFAPQPLWYDEGTAEFYRSFRATGSEAQIGLPIEDHIALLRNTKMMPLEQLFAVDQNSPEYTEDQRREVFYAESWALVHYLLRGNPERTAQLGQFLVLLQQGKPRDEAFHEAFKVDYGALFAELFSYVRGSRYTYARYAYSDLAIAPDTKVDRLSYAETLYRLGDLLAHQSDRAGDAEAYFRAGLAADPSLSGAEAGLGRLRLEADRPEEAAEHFQRAIASGHADFLAYYYDGFLRTAALAKAWAWPMTEAERAGIDAARAALARSIELNPDFPEARYALGRTYVVEEGDRVSEGIAELTIAAKLLPTRTDIAEDLADLIRRKREYDSTQAASSEPPASAGAPAARGKAPGANPPLAIMSGKASEPLDGMAAVNALLSEHRETEAVAMLEGLVEKSTGAYREAYAEELRKLKALRAYNAAMAHLRRREYAVALEAFEKLAASGPDSDIGKAARRQAAEIRGILKKR